MKNTYHSYFCNSIVGNNKCDCGYEKSCKQTKISCKKVVNKEKTVNRVDEALSINRNCDDAECEVCNDSIKRIKSSILSIILEALSKEKIHCHYCDDYDYCEGCIEDIRQIITKLFT